MFHKRRYIPVNTQKYSGDPTNIIMRSSWETKFASWCDHNPSVIKWKSEETVVPYRCPLDNKIHRYFVDFQIQIKDKNDVLKTYLIEIKPKKQTKEPEQQRRVTKRYITEVTTWGVNQAKWKAATEYCLDRNWEFKLITEDHLGL